MARLTAAARNALPDSAFAGPNRTYPVPDRAHAVAAKGRATEFAGPKLKAKIDKKANQKLRKGRKTKPNRFSRDSVLSRPDME